jgi:hypothetical protein
MTLDAARLRETLAYDPVTGIFTRRVSNLARWKVGSEAGSLHSLGYRIIAVDGVMYRAHRLAWLYVHGQWPDGLLDHANGDRADNRIANLRPATVSQNKANSKLRSDNKSGFKGVYASELGGWRAEIRCDGKLHYLGRFGTPELAHAAYVAAARRFFGEFARAA